MGWFPTGPSWADSCLGPQVDQLKLKVSRLEEECALLRRARGPLPGPEDKEEPDGADLLSELRAENQRLTASLQELQEGLQQVRPWCWDVGQPEASLCCPLSFRHQRLMANASPAHFSPETLGP